MDVNIEEYLLLSLLCLGFAGTPKMLCLKETNNNMYYCRRHGITFVNLNVEYSFFEHRILKTF